MAMEFQQQMQMEEDESVESVHTESEQERISEA
jgi:hypothetical protein